MKLKNNNEYEIPNTLFLVGNGLDLNNGLETSYNSFIMDYIKKAIKWTADNEYPYMDDCLKIEMDISNFKSDKTKLDLFFDEFEKKFIPENHFVTQYNKRQQLISNFPHLIITPQTDFVKNILKNFIDQDWSGIENEIYKILKAAHHKCENSERKQNDPSDTSVQDSNIKSLNLSIECLTKNLIKYLTLNNQPKKSNNKISTFIRNKIEAISKHDKENYNQTYSNFHVLNFNYTTYLDKEIQFIRDYYNGINELVCIHKMNSIHGRLEDDIDDIIFGIGDEQEKFLKDVESYYSDCWLKSIKSYKYLRKNNYQNLIEFTDLANYEIYVIGHSCSITDRTLLKMLFENSNCKKIHVLHRGMSSYMSICYNISRNFSDKIKMRKVLQPYDESLKFRS